MTSDQLRAIFRRLSLSVGVSSFSSIEKFRGKIPRTCSTRLKVSLTISISFGVFCVPFDSHGCGQEKWRAVMQMPLRLLHRGSRGRKEMDVDLQ